MQLHKGIPIRDTTRSEQYANTFLSTQWQSTQLAAISISHVLKQTQQQHPFTLFTHLEHVREECRLIPAWSCFVWLYGPGYLRELRYSITYTASEVIAQTNKRKAQAWQCALYSTCYKL
jgi:hypothetical protein